MVKRFNSAKLNDIINELLESINKSKNKATKFYKVVIEKINTLEIELTEVKIQIKWLDIEIRKTWEESKKHRNNLLRITRDMAKNPEDKQIEYKEAYEKADKLLLKMKNLEYEYKTSFRRRDKIERELKRLKEVLIDAEELIQTITTSFKYLNNDLVDISNKLNQKEIILLKIIESGENDKKNIARDIHDGPAQTLAYLTFEMQLLKTLIEVMDSGDIIKKVDDINQHLQGALDEIRQIIYDLRPMSLDDLGLVPTIENYIKEFSESRGIDISFELIDNNKLVYEIPNALCVAIFRIIQESLNNVYKHSESATATVTIELLKNVLKLEVSDNGKGFDVDKVLKEVKENGNFGLLGMTERVNLIGGDIDILSTKNGGTKIKVSIPWDFSK